MSLIGMAMVHPSPTPFAAPPAILQKGDFSVRIPKIQHNLLTRSGLQRDERIYSSAASSE